MRDEISFSFPYHILQFNFSSTLIHPANMGIILSSAASGKHHPLPPLTRHNNPNPPHHPCKPVTLSSVICNVIGSAILHRAHPNAAYNVLWASRNGAVGGAILTIPLLIFFQLLNTCYLTTCFERSSALVQELVGYAGWILAVSNSAAAGALGARVLIASLGQGKVKQGVKESAAAGGVGSGVLLAALWALAVLAGLVVLAIKGMGWIRLKIVDKKVARDAAQDGHHELGQMEWRAGAGMAHQPQEQHGNQQTGRNEGFGKTDLPAF